VPGGRRARTRTLTRRLEEAALGDDRVVGERERGGWCRRRRRRRRGEIVEGEPGAGADADGGQVRDQRQEDELDRELLASREDHGRVRVLRQVARARKDGRRPDGRLFLTLPASVAYAR